MFAVALLWKPTKLLTIPTKCSRISGRYNQWMNDKTRQIWLILIKTLISSLEYHQPAYQRYSQAYVSFCVNTKKKKNNFWLKQMSELEFHHYFVCKSLHWNLNSSILSNWWHIPVAMPFGTAMQTEMSLKYASYHKSLSLLISKWIPKCIHAARSLGLYIK